MKFRGRANRSAEEISLTKSSDGIAKFLELKGHTLLIKGPPSAGKTTLALQLLKHFGEKHHVHFVARIEREVDEQDFLRKRMCSRKLGLKTLDWAGPASTVIDKVLVAQQKRGYV